MRERKALRAVLLLVACSVFSQPSVAQGRGHGLGKQEHARIEFPERDDARVLIRGHGIFLNTRPTGRPPGWNRGRKVGWGNCDLPPGQAKKFGCSGFVFRGRPNRRPVIFIPLP